MLLAFLNLLHFWESFETPKNPLKYPVFGLSPPSALSPAPQRASIPAVVTMEKRQPLFKRTCSRTSTLRSLWYIYLFPRGLSLRAPKGFHLYDCKKSVKKRKEMTTMIFRVCSLSREDNNNIVAWLWRWLPLRISKRQILQPTTVPFSFYSPAPENNFRKLIKEYFCNILG